MQCPKCKKDSAVLVTSKASKKTTERIALVWWILFLPFTFLWWAFKMLFVNKRQNYAKKQEWHCQYCNNKWKQTFEE